MNTTGYISTPDLTTKPNANYGELVDFWNKGHKTIVEQNVDSFIERLMSFIESGEIEDYVAEQLADIFDRTLTRTVDVRMSIVLDAQVTVPVGYDLDDLHNDVGVELNDLCAADVQIESIEVSTIDVDIQEA